MWKRIVNDIVIWIISSVVCLLWRVVADKETIAAYISVFAVMAVIWIILGLITLKYRRSYKEAWYWQEMLSLVLTGGGLMGLCVWQWKFIPYNVSLNVALWMVGIVMIFDAIAILLKHYWKFALNMTIPQMVIKHRRNAKPKRGNEERSHESKHAIIVCLDGEF